MSLGKMDGFLNDLEMKECVIMFVYIAVHGLSVFCRVITLSWRAIYSTFTFWCLSWRRSCPEEGIYGRFHFSEVSAFSQLRDVPRRVLSASVQLLMSSSQRNLHTNSKVPSGSSQQPLGRLPTGQHWEQEAALFADDLEIFQPMNPKF